MSFSLVPGFAQRYPKVDDDLLIESCCTSLDEARWAETRGANRIELCTDLSVGGLTPPRDLIREVVQALTIPVNVLIRPSSRESGAGGIADRKHTTLGAVRGRGPCAAWEGSSGARRFGRQCQSASRDEGREGLGFTAADFVYDEAALEQMIDDIGYCKTVGVSGIVVGALTEEGAIDLPAMRRLVAAARPLPVTFHRAFDVCTDDPFTALDQIIALGCTRLLTSGRATSAWEGRNLIALLVRRAGTRLSVMPGAGIKREKTAALADATAAVEFHGTAIP